MDDQRPTPTRPCLKTKTHFNNFPSWKHKLREICCKRVREDRSRLLWKLRLTATAKSLDDKDFIKSALKDIVSEELKKFDDSSLKSFPKITTPNPELEDILWEYDGLHNSYQGECEEILLEMQKIFYDDLTAEPTSKGPKNYTGTWEDEEDEYLARAVFEHMHLNNEQAIWCPICKQGELKDDHKLIYCTQCELQLSKGDEVNLDILKSRLAEAHAEHLDRGCRLKPEFCIKNMFDLTALYIFCQGCNLLEIVI